jgi:hypothetical protein
LSHLSSIVSCRAGGADAGSARSIVGRLVAIGRVIATGSSPAASESGFVDDPALGAD